MCLGRFAMARFASYVVRVGVAPTSALAFSIGGSVDAQALTKAVIVLDPDDNVGYASWPGIGTVTELPNNMRLANEVKTRLEDECRAEVVLTRDGSQDTVSRDARKAAVIYPSGRASAGLDARPGLEV